MSGLNIRHHKSINPAAGQHGRRRTSRSVSVNNADGPRPSLLSGARSGSRGFLHEATQQAFRGAQQEIDQTFGSDYARKHPEVVSAVMIAASLDWAAMTIAAALVTEEESVPHNRDPAWCGRRVWCGHENVGRRQL